MIPARCGRFEEYSLQIRVALSLWGHEVRIYTTEDTKEQSVHWVRLAVQGLKPAIVCVRRQG